MKARWIAIVGGLVLVGILALTGTAAAMAWGSNGRYGPFATRQNTTTQQTTTGWGPMMGEYGPYGPGGMMGRSGGYGPGGVMGTGGGYGPGGMMGGYASAQQDPSSTAPVTGNSVAIQNFAFQPANLQVKVGTTVTWTNNDTAPHTVTFRDSSVTSSALLQKGQTYSYTFTKTGTFSYYCAVHPFMAGQVTVTA